MWNPDKLVLIHTQTGDPVKVGENVVDFRGESARVEGWERPRHPGSTGRVIVREKGSTMLGRYFPSVYNLHFAELVRQTGEPMKAIYWTQVETTNTKFAGATTLAFPVRVLPSDDERLERRRASIAARRKVRSMEANIERVHVVSVERVEPTDSRLV